MALPRIFVSYSAKPCANQCAWKGQEPNVCSRREGVPECARHNYELKFLADLEGALGADNFHIVWDERVLLAGEDWKEWLYPEFARCQAALVLLTESSVESHYVPLEAMVLTCRSLLDPSFRVIPVFFHPVDENSLSKPDSKYRGIGLETKQGIKHQRGEEGATFEKIRNRLSDITLKQPAAVQRLARLLNCVQTDQLEAAAAKLESNYEWRPGLDRPFQLALSILSTDLVTAATALHMLVSGLNLEQQRTLFYKILAPSWVDLRVVSPIWEALVNPPPKKLFLLNSGWRSSAEHYVRRAWTDAADEPEYWFVTAVDDGSGQGYRQAILRKFQEAHEFDNEMDGFDEASLATNIEHSLKERSKQQKPVYVGIFHLEGTSEKGLLTVQEELHVTVVYMRPDVTKDSSNPNLSLLEPMLTPEKEQCAMQDYVYAKGLIIVGASKR